MVRNLKNITPIINFENTKAIYKVVSLNSINNIWLKTIINSDIIVSALECNLPFTKNNDYKYTVTANQTGLYRIRIKLAYTNKRNSKIKYGQDLLLVVVEPIT